MSEIPQVFSLRHRFEFEPDIEASWRLYGEKPPLLIDNAKLADDLEYLFSVSRKIVNLAPIRGVSGRAQVLQALVQRIEIESNRRVGLALVAAACTLASTPDEVAEVWEAVQDHSLFRLPVEELLVAQRSKLGLRVWRSRLESSGDSGTHARLVAIEGLGAAGGLRDLKILRLIFEDSNELITLRISAAKSLGQIAAVDLEDLARKQLGSTDIQKELMASFLLSQHRSDEAVSMLTSIIESDAVAAQLVSFRALINAKPATAREYVDQFKSAADSTLRLEVIRLSAKLNDAKSVQCLSAGLGDQVQGNREAARSALKLKAMTPELRSIVIQQLDGLLQDADYLQREQACLLAGELAYQEACPELLNLVNDPHPRTRNAAAWALQELVHEPEHLRRIEKILADATQRNFGKEPLALTEAVRVAFLVEALGRNNFGSANRTLVRYVRKGSAEPVLRAAAIWTLGKNLRGNPNRQLANMLAQRLNDTSPSPESPLVQYVCAIALGMMGDLSSESELRRHTTRPPFPIGLAREWALKQYDAEQSN
ncbi:MAG: HEAT repeat domain-containing protein [Pirellulaceae bacterium]